MAEDKIYSKAYVASLQRNSDALLRIVLNQLAEAEARWAEAQAQIVVLTAEAMRLQKEETPTSDEE